MARNSKLTPKQQSFADEYLVDLNATQAAIRAGYSEKTAGSQGFELLKKPEIADAIQSAMQERAERTGITQDRVLRELARIGFADIRKVVTWGNTELRVTDSSGEDAIEVYHGLALKAADEIDDETAAAIAEVSQGRDGLKIKFHDKRAALVDIGRHLGMFKEKVEMTGPNGGPIQHEQVGNVKALSDDELDTAIRIAAKLQSAPKE